MANETLIYGIHPVMAALQHHPENVLAIFCEKDTKNPRLKPIFQLAEESGLTIQTVSSSKIEKMAGGTQHQGIVATLKASRTLDEKSLIGLLKDEDKKLLFLVLEGVQDPHNLGACLRSAEALGVDAIIIPKDNSAPLNATVSKAASGAMETLSIVMVTNVVRCLEALKKEGMWVVGTSDKGAKEIHQIKLPKRMVLVMGSEGKGLKRLTLETCDEVVQIPLKGTVNSLNVSVATGICLYEWHCQQG